MGENLSIDARYYTGWTGYANHSCSPNAEAKKIKMHIYFYALKDIEIGEEITIDYKFENVTKKDHVNLCFCNSKKCTGLVGMLPKDILCRIGEDLD